MCDREEVAKELIVEYLSRQCSEVAGISQILAKIWDVSPRVPAGFPPLEKLAGDLPHQLPESTLEAGKVALGIGNFDAATGYLSDYLDVNANDNNALLKRASAIMKQGRFDAAIEDLKVVVKADETNGRAWAKLIFAFWSAGLYEEAKSAYDRAITVCNDSDVHDMLVLLGRQKS